MGYLAGLYGPFLLGPHLASTVDVTTITPVNTRYTWNETKRRKNLRKHGMDLRDGWKVLESRYRLEIDSVRNQEARKQVFTYVYDVLMVLTLVYVPTEDALRFISLRRANHKERETYYEWLDSEDVQP